ncbi:cytochrome c biogenesis protein DipZ [Paraburkholderia phymatum]|uniref:Redoxin domain protein n=1 Tax=Paraburkholderia phymatum (strain DSM 17167 / CIP 108236 / LMG 21445 / STM815) TaxID=391038 RepID=B2JLF5_PARP8|nr:cytochrome c biogenesis protein DipZ [Paraburkholderia phymatum]ACC74123.1 Redoxin domain protein [Paraburkholderia phymatum STM815]
MLLIVIAFLGGVLTILSPCILPVVPFVFARSDRPFVTGRLPLLIGLAVTFAVVTGVGVAGLAGAARLSHYGRGVSLALFAVFGLSLLFPALWTRVSRPFFDIGNRVEAFSHAQGTRFQVVSALLLGAATGLLWAPCAGPILGLILTGAALHGASWTTAAALTAYAFGAASSLAVASGLGKQALDGLKRSLGFGERVRRFMGALVLLSVVGIGFGFDTRALAHVPSTSTTGVESRPVGLLSADGGSRPHLQRVSVQTPSKLPVEGTLPSLDGAQSWLNSPPLTADALRGKVTVVNFWTYSCINCLRTLPYLKTWSDRYGQDGLVVVGVHTPEFAFERDPSNVKRAVRDLGIRYPVAIDNGYGIWQAFGNQYWPAFYIVDAQGRIRYHHFGEGGYGEAEKVIQQLLADSGHTMPTGDLPPIHGAGAQAAADASNVESGETYVGYQQARGFASPQDIRPDDAASYSIPSQLPLNSWAFGGRWIVGGEAAVASEANGRIAYRFHARDLHLVLGPGANGKPVRFRVTIDGAAPGDSHGADIAADGTGVVTSARLYQLVRQHDAVRDRTFTIEFLDPGVQAFSFTFG